MKKTINKIISLVLCAVTVFSVGSLAACGDNGVTTFEVCNDESNAVRAFELLTVKGVIDKDVEGDNYPIADGGEKLNFNGDNWYNKAKTVKVSLIAENLLVSSMPDYDYALLPCNTAYTGNVSSEKRVQKEDGAAQVAGKANVIAARKSDYETNAEYKNKIDALTNVMLSKAVSDYFNNKYLGAMTCDESSQIDLRTNKDATVNGNNTKITVCASTTPHAEVLKECVKAELLKVGYVLEVKELDWTTQNDAVAKGDYDANYFQHVPYLETYKGNVQLFASCKVHYEPLGIYLGKASEWKF